MSEDEELALNGGEDNREGTPGRRDYDDIAKNIGLFTQQTEDRFSRWFKLGLGIIAFVGLTTSLAIFGFGIVLSEIKDQADRNEELASLIQVQREDSIRNECEKTNKRHDGAVAALIAGSDQDQANAPNEAVRKEIRRRRDVTIALLDALAPHEDCEEKVKKAVKTPPAPKKEKK